MKYHGILEGKNINTRRIRHVALMPLQNHKARHTTPNRQQTVAKINKFSSPSFH
jgi:hypothetical protein